MLTGWRRIYTECFGLFIYSSRIYYRPAMCCLPLVFGNFLVNTAAKDPTLIVLHSNRNGRQTINDLSINQEEWPVTEQTLKKGNGIETEYAVKTRSMLINSDEEAAVKHCSDFQAGNANSQCELLKREQVERLHKSVCGHGGGREWHYSRYIWGWNQLNLLMDSMWVVRKREKWVILVGTPGTVHWCGKTR